jgi:hypothetical protein
MHVNPKPRFEKRTIRRFRVHIQTIIGENALLVATRTMFQRSPRPQIDSFSGKKFAKHKHLSPRQHNFLLLLFSVLHHFGVQSFEHVEDGFNQESLFRS